MRFCVYFAGGGPGGREPPQDEPRDPKRKKEKPKEVKILRNSSAKPGTWETARNTEQQKRTIKSQSLK